MADCSDLRARQRELEEKLAAAEKLQRSVEGEESAKAAAEEASTSADYRSFKMIDGTRVNINMKEWYAKAEADNVAMGEDALKEYVLKNIAINKKPNGSKGENINYSQLNPDEETLNSLLVMAGQDRQGTKFGQELAMPFTNDVAASALADQIALQGGNVKDIAKDLTRFSKKVMRLPSMMSLAKRMKLDSMAYYADLLEGAADEMEGFGLPPQRKQELERAGQWAYLFEQNDAVMARKVGQALRARSFDMAAERWDEAAEGVSFGELQTLDVDKLNPGSLASQILEAIESGNAEELRKIARAKRVGALNDVGMNDSNVLTQVKILNTLRKDNLFLSPSTWIQRNVVAGGLMNFSNGMEDFYSVAFKTKDLGAAYKASTVAYMRMMSGMGAAFENAFEAFMTGKSTFTSAGLKEGFDPSSLANRKQNNQAQMQATWDTLNESWSNVFEDPGDAAGVTLPAILNLANLSARWALGTALEATTGSTMGFQPAFSLLQMGDEVTRKMAFDWKVGMDSYVNAMDEWDRLETKPSGVSKAQWLASRSNERADAAVFNGVMTDDELVKLRRQQGVYQYGDVDNDSLRLKIFNDQNGLPNPSSPEGLAGLQRGAEATFTQKISNPVGQGINLARQNPVIGWVMPVFTTPWNGLKWLLDRDMFVRLPKQLAMEIRQRRGIGDQTPFTAKEMAESRAKTVNAMFISAATYGAWQTGMFTDGGSFNPDQRKRENRNAPYAFSVGLAGLQMGLSRFQVSGRSIDLVDLMGLQADIHRAHHENLITDFDLGQLMAGVVQGYARIFDNKQSLSGVMDIMNALSRTASGQNVDWAETMAGQMSGVLPLSGAMLQGSRSLQDPNVNQERRRDLTTTERSAIQADPNWNLFQRFASKLTKNYPVVGNVGYQTRNRDWLGRERRRVFGIPADAAAPFAPMITSDTPLDRWMEKHGFGAPPHPGGKIGAGDTRKGYGGATMSLEEENTWHEKFTTMKGEAPAAFWLGEKNAVISTGFNVYPIDRYVQGNTLLEALTALSQDPEYNYELNERPHSPSLAREKGERRPYSEQSLSERTKSINDPSGLYKVWDAVVNYYDRQAIDYMGEQHQDFVEKALANAEVKDVRRQEDAEALIP